MITKNRIIKIASKFDSVGSDKSPVSIQAAINDNCFNDCIMCSHPQKPVKHTVSGSDWCSFIKKCSDIGLESVCYSGGDPFAHKDINMIMEAHIQLGIAFGFITTGYIPKSINRDYLKYASWIRVSLDAINPESYAKVRGLIKVEKVLDCIDEMIDLGIEVGLAPTVHHYNKDDIFDVLDYALLKGLYVGVKTAYEGTIDLTGIDWNRIESYRTYFDNKGLELRVYNGTDYESFNKCNAVYYQLFVDSKGDVYPCCTLGGDVTLEPAINALTNIRYGIENVIHHRNAFSKLDSTQRPSGCKNCIGRLTEINHIVELVDLNKQFF